MLAEQQAAIRRENEDLEMHGDLYEKVGRLTGLYQGLITQVNQLERTVNEKINKMETSINKQSEKIDSVLDILSQSKGGWKVLVIVGTVLMAIGTAVGWLLSYISHLPT